MTSLQTKNKCGKAMTSSCNINKGIQLIIDVIDSKMLKEKKNYDWYIIRVRL